MGSPLSIHSNQGEAFESRLIRELCELLEIKKTRTSARNPRGNGQVERFNRSLLKMIRCYLADEQDEWDSHLEALAGAYRATPHEATKLTRNMVMIGREVRLPSSIVYGHLDQDLDTNTSEVDFLLQAKARLQRTHDFVRKQFYSSIARSKEIYDSKLSFHQYQVGDLVWFLYEARQVGVNPKLEKA